VSALDWTVLFGALMFFVAYGVWRGRGERDLTDYLLAGRAMRWPVVALSVMATQASAITFLATPGQGYADGLRFVQFYLGLPLAMIVICVTAIPIYHQLRVFTAYEYLEGRFDGKTRTLAAALFLIQRGLAAGLTIYAPSLVLSVVLGWDVRATAALLGGLAVLYTASGGSKAVSHTQVLQFLIIIGTMGVAFALIVASFPSGVGVGEAARAAGQLGRFNALDLTFDPNNRYNLWSGLIGGFFLQLSYFGTDQSQVGRYLTGRSTTDSRLGLIFNGLAKLPMQLAILFLGVMVYVFYLFTPPPLFFNPAEMVRLESGPHAALAQALERRHVAAFERRRVAAEALLASERAHDVPHAQTAGNELRAADGELREVRAATVTLMKAAHPDAQTSDTNYVFLRYVLGYLPAGLIGLVFAAIFAASMNSSSAELNALTSTTVVDVIRRARPSWTDGARGVRLSRVVTLFWAAFAVAFAEYASRLGSLIEAVNILGSLFYGTILGLFLTAFYVKRVGGTAAFTGAVVAELVVLACFKLTNIGFLWYNLIGCAVVILVGLALTAAGAGRQGGSGPERLVAAPS
jgi:SSS family transporter